MKRNTRLVGRAVAGVLLTLAVGVQAGVAGAGEGPTVAQLDDGLLETSDLIAGFAEVGRGAPAPQEVAKETGAFCDGPNNAARGLEIDDSIQLAGAAFETPNRTATFNEDAYVFSTPKAAKAFIKATKKQQAGCEDWMALVSTETVERNFELVSVKKVRVGDQGLRIKILVSAPGAPVDPTTALKREFVYVRLGSVVLSLNYSQEAGFTAKSPGPGYPKSAAEKMESALG